MSTQESSSENGAYRIIPGGPLDPEMIVAPKGQWHDGAVETFDAGAAYHKCGCGGAGHVTLTVGLWAEGKGDDPARLRDLQRALNDAAMKIGDTLDARDDGVKLALSGVELEAPIAAEGGAV